LVDFRNYLPFLRHDFVTDYCYFYYEEKLICNKYLLNLLQNQIDEHRR